MNDEEGIKLIKGESLDSVLCHGKMREFQQSNVEWEKKLQWFIGTLQYRELDGIDGELSSIS